VAQDDWNDGSLENWYENQAWVSMVNPGSGGVTNSGYLNIQMDATDPINELDGAEWWAFTRVDATNFYSGIWQTNYNMQFSFWASNVVPEYIQVRWSGSTNRVWRDTVFDRDLNSMSTQSWQTLVSDYFYNWASWDYGGGTEADFLNDLATIDWVGVFIWRGDASLQNYGIDDFALTVPEPAAWVLALTALVVSGRSLSRRRKGRPPSGGSG